MTTRLLSARRPKVGCNAAIPHAGELPSVVNLDMRALQLEHPPWSNRYPPYYFYRLSDMYCKVEEVGMT